MHKICHYIDSIVNPTFKICRIYAKRIVHKYAQKYAQNMQYIHKFM